MLDDEVDPLKGGSPEAKQGAFALPPLGAVRHGHAGGVSDPSSIVPYSGVSALAGSGVGAGVRVESTNSAKVRPPIS